MLPLPEELCPPGVRMFCQGKEPALQHSHYINKIRCPSSTAPRVCGQGRGKEAGRGATAQLSRPRWGTGRLKGLLPTQDKDLHLGCSHHDQLLVRTMALCEKQVAEPQAATSTDLEGPSSTPK